MKNNLLKILILILVSFPASHKITAVEPYMPYMPEFMTRNPMLTPASWDKVSISGKLSTDLLPIRPTLKVYMECDSLLCAQISVPLFGEVARAEATTTTVRLYNKRKNVYYEKNLADVAKVIGENITLGNLQDLLLGRPFTPGQPEFECTSELLEYDTMRDSWWIKYNYPNYNVMTGMMIDTDGRLLHALCARFLNGMTPDAMPDDTAAINFSYPGSKTRLECHLVIKNKLTDATYEYGTPDWSPGPVKPLNLNSGWHKVETFREFIKSF